MSGILFFIFASCHPLRMAVHASKCTPKLWTHTNKSTLTTFTRSNTHPSPTHPHTNLHIYLCEYAAMSDIWLDKSMSWEKQKMDTPDTPQSTFTTSTRSTPMHKPFIFTYVNMQLCLIFGWTNQWVGRNRRWKPQTHPKSLSQPPPGLPPCTNHSYLPVWICSYVWYLVGQINELGETEDGNPRHTPNHIHNLHQVYPHAQTIHIYLCEYAAMSDIWLDKSMSWEKQKMDTPDTPQSTFTTSTRSTPMHKPFIFTCVNMQLCLIFGWTNQWVGRSRRSSTCWQKNSVRTKVHITYWI